MSNAVKQQYCDTGKVHRSTRTDAGYIPKCIAHRCIRKTMAWETLSHRMYHGGITKPTGRVILGSS